MARPRSEREAIEEELAELPAQIESYQRDLDAAPVDARARREGLQWRIRRAEKRIADLRERLRL